MGVVITLGGAIRLLTVRSIKLHNVAIARIDRLHVRIPGSGKNLQH